MHICRMGSARLFRVFCQQGSLSDVASGRDSETSMTVMHVKSLDEAEALYSALYHIKTSAEFGYVPVKVLPGGALGSPLVCNFM